MNENEFVSQYMSLIDEVMQKSVTNFDPEKIGEFLTKCFIGVNVLTNRFALDNSYNTKITELIKKVVFDTLKIPNNDGI